MSEKNECGSACGMNSSSAGCCVEAILTIDDRGQVVLPKDVRTKAGFNAGDKLALISWEREGSVCCLALMRVENLSGMVRDVLSPIIHEQD